MPVKVARGKRRERAREDEREPPPAAVAGSAPETKHGWLEDMHACRPRTLRSSSRQLFVSRRRERRYRRWAAGFSITGNCASSRRHTQNRVPCMCTAPVRKRKQEHAEREARVLQGCSRMTCEGPRERKGSRWTVADGDPLSWSSAEEAALPDSVLVRSLPQRWLRRQGGRDPPHCPAKAINGPLQTHARFLAILDFGQLRWGHSAVCETT